MTTQILFLKPFWIWKALSIIPAVRKKYSVYCKIIYQIAKLQSCKEPPEMMLYSEAESRDWHLHGLVSSLQQTAISPRYFNISSHPRIFLVAACSPTPFPALISTFGCPSHLSGLFQQVWTPVFWHQQQPFCGSHMASKTQTCLPRHRVFQLTGHKDQEWSGVSCLHWILDLPVCWGAQTDHRQKSSVLLYWTPTCKQRTVTVFTAWKTAHLLWGRAKGQLWPTGYQLNNNSLTVG